MKKVTILIIALFVANIISGQETEELPKAKVMTLGVFHFAYPNLDAVKTSKSDQISVLEEPYQSEILAICKAIKEFQPNKIAIELDPKHQDYIDSLYLLYQSGSFSLKKSETYQLGFRIGKDLGLNKIYCVNDWGRHYSNMESLFNDSARLANFENYHSKFQDSIYKRPLKSEKVTSIINELEKSNNPEYIKDRLSGYLLNPFKYEEQLGDFTGVDFETGRWFNRNLRIFRNIQRITDDPNDRVLLIIGSDHLNLLNMFIDVSREFDLVSPLPYLEKAKKINP